MGTWGINNFENDDASDWVFTLEKSKGLDGLLQPINKIISETGYLETPYCTEALAAAEIISASRSNDFTKIPDEAKQWLEKKPGLFSKKPEILISHAKLAQQAVQKILTSSELQELWEETDDYEDWKMILNDLLVSLN